MFGHYVKKPENTELIRILNRILKLEYSLIVSYPRIARKIEDRDIQDLVTSLGTASIKHADVVASAMRKLGGTPTWSFEVLRDNLSLDEIFTIQLEKENIAQKTHQECADLTRDSDLKREFATMAEEEKSHINIVERIIAHLKLSTLRHPVENRDVETQGVGSRDTESGSIATIE